MSGNDATVMLPTILGLPRTRNKLQAIYTEIILLDISVS